MSKKWALIVILIAVVIKMLRPAPIQQFAFDGQFPADGSTWLFEVVLDEDSTKLAEVEAELLDKLDMSPMFRCGNGVFGERWIDRPYFSKRDILLQAYRLVLEDTVPPSENSFIIRHQLLGYKVPMTTRHDKFTCAKKKKGKCIVWDSTGYVSPHFTKKLTDDETSYPYYQQKLTYVPNSNEVEKKCPIRKEAWWCLWLFCPAA